METETIEGILRCFETISGLRVNIRISMIVGVEVEMRKVGQKWLSSYCQVQRKQVPNNIFGAALGTIRDRSQCWIQ